VFVGPLLGDELPVPTKDGVGGDERSNLREGASSNSLASHGKASALIVGQPESTATRICQGWRTALMGPSCRLRGTIDSYPRTTKPRRIAREVYRSYLRTERVPSAASALADIPRVRRRITASTSLRVNPPISNSKPVPMATRTGRRYTRVN
jgi:hypothetical protein